MLHQSIMEMRPEQRPDEKFLSFGPEALSDAELLAIILRTGTRDASSVDLAEQILNPEEKSGNNLLSIFDYEIEDLMKMNGVGKVKALQIKAVLELSKRIAMTRAAKDLCFNNSGTVAEYYMEQFRHEKQEEVFLIMLDSGGFRLRERRLFLGTVNTALFSPREILIDALRSKAVSVILLHNHPSGDPMPSEEDIRATKRVEDACDLIGIKLVDHIIIGDNTYFSFFENQMLGSN